MWHRIPISEIEIGDRLGVSGKVKSINEIDNDKVRISFEMDGAYVFNKCEIVNIYRLYNNKL